MKTKYFKGYKKRDFQVMELTCPHCSAKHRGDYAARPIGGRLVPALGIYSPTVVHFTAGARGKRERGDYAFWTLHGRDNQGPFTIIGRARVSLGPWDRFARMAEECKGQNIPVADRVTYAAMYDAITKGAEWIEPSHPREVRRWLDTHDRDPHNDAQFADPVCVMRGRDHKKLPARSW